MTDPLDIEIGVVIRWKKNSPKKVSSRDKPAYFIFLGCYNLDKEWYVILARTTARIQFYVNGNRQNEPHLLINMDGFHPCFDKKSAISHRDFFEFHITAEDFLKHLKNGNIEKKCKLNKEELNKVMDLFKKSNEVIDIVKEAKIREFLDYLITIDYL